MKRVLGRPLVRRRKRTSADDFDSRADRPSKRARVRKGKVAQAQKIIKLENEVKSLRLLIEQLVAAYGAEDSNALEQVARLTPSIDKLQELSLQSPPPAEWFAGNVERPW